MFRRIAVHFERPFGKQRIGARSWWLGGAFGLAAVFSSAVAGAQPSDRKIRSILDMMAARQQRFDSRALHDLGQPGLSAVLDFLLPDTAEETTIDVPDETIARLVEQLGDESYRVRQTASEKLLDMGPSIRTALLPAIESEDAEIRWRTTRILRRWSGATDEDKNRYIHAFSAYVSGISDDERLDELVRRTLLAFKAGMPENGSGRKTILITSIRAITRSRKNLHVNRLKPLLEHEDVNVAVLVTQTVASGCGTTFLPEFLLDALDNGRDEVVEQAMLRTVNSTDAGRNEKIKRRLVKIFEGDNESLKLTACYPLMRNHRYPPAIDYLLEQATSKDLSRANRALMWLGDSRNRGQPVSKKMLATFDVLLKSEDWSRRHLACRILSMYSGEEVVKRLIPLLNDEKAAIGTEVGNGLLRQQDKKMVRRLLGEAAKQHPDEEVRKKAATVLEKVKAGRSHSADDPFAR